MTELQRLRDRVEQLESVLGADDQLSAKLMAVFGLMERDHAVMLGMLYQRDVVTRDGLYTVLYGEEAEHEWPNDKIMDQRLHKLRAALKAHSIEVETVRAVGWRISREAKALVKRTITGPTPEEILECDRIAFGLEPKEAQILALMMSRPSITARSLEHIVSGYGSARVRIHCLRRKLEQFGISVSGRGRWHLPELSRVKVVTFRNNLLDGGNYGCENGIEAQACA